MANNIRNQLSAVNNSRNQAKQAAIAVQQKEQETLRLAEQMAIEAQEARIASVKKLNEVQEQARQAIMTAENNAKKSAEDEQRTRSAAKEAFNRLQKKPNPNASRNPTIPSNRNNR